MYKRFGNRRVVFDSCTFCEGTIIEFPCNSDGVQFTLVVKKYFYTPAREMDSELIAELSLGNLCYEKGPIYFISDIIAQAEEISGESVPKPVYVDPNIVNMYYEKK